MTHTPAGHVLQQAGALAQSRDALRLAAETVAHSYLRGPHGRRRTGVGESFWQFRPYNAGDVPRDIDWRQTAKRDDVFVREREHDAAQALWVWSDRAAGMRYSSAPRYAQKADMAEIIVLAASLLSLEGGERVGVLGSGQGARSHVSALEQLQAHLDDAPVLDARLMPAGSRAMCLLASDFYCDPAVVDAVCANARARDNRIVLLQVCDPAEEDLPWHGRVRFDDVTDATQGVMIDDVDALRAQYREKFTRHCAELSAIAQRHGGVFLHARTDEKAEAILDRVIDAIAAAR